MYGHFRNVPRSPAKCGISPRAKVGRVRSVIDVGRLQAVREAALDLFLMAPVRQQRLGLLGPVSFAIDAVLIIFGHSGPSSRRGHFSDHCIPASAERRP